MIKLPKQVKEIIKKLRDKGYEAYAVGACVRNSLLGDKPLDWDVATNAGLDVLNELFKDGKVMSERLSVVRIYDADHYGYLHL